MSVKLKLTMMRGSSFEARSTLEIKSSGIESPADFDAEVRAITKSEVYKSIMDQIDRQHAFVVATEIEVKRED